MSFLRNLYFFQGQKYTSFGKNILHRQSASLGHSATGHSGLILLHSVFSPYGQVIKLQLADSDYLVSRPTLTS